MKPQELVMKPQDERTPMETMEAFLKGEIELQKSVIDEEIGRVKLALGWLMVNTDDCFEKNYLSNLLKKRYETLMKKEVK